MTELKDHNNY